MKKAICIFVACLMLLSGCGRFVNDSVPTTIHKEHNESYSIRPLKALQTPEEIEAFAKSELAPSGFVKPEDLSVFGISTDTVYFYPEADSNSYIYERYLISVCDANGVDYYMQIDHSGYPGYETRYAETNFTKTKLSKSQGMVNMLRLETADTGWITCGKVKYFYIRGELDTIIFNIGDIEFAVKYIGEIKNYPMDKENTFLKRLLSTNEREISAAVEEFRLVILLRDPAAWLIPAGIGVGVIALGVTGFVIWKKKKRKAVNEPESSQPQPIDTPQ